VKDFRGLQNAVRRVADPLVRLRHVVNEALILVPRADGATVELLGEDGWLTNVCAAGTLSPHVGTRLHEGNLSELAISRGEVLWATDTEDDPRVDREVCRRQGIGSVVCVPLRSHGRPVGVLRITASRPGALTGDDVAVLTTVADFLSVVVGAVADLGTVTSALMSREEWHPAIGGEAVAERSSVTAFVANVLTPNLAEDVAAFQRVRDVIDNADVAIVFQPVIELATGALAGYEALTRFPDLRPPNVWFDEAHRVGLGIELELFALTTVLASTPEHMDGFLAVNVSPVVVASPGIHLCLASRPRGCDLVVELTEHDSIDDYQAIRSGIEQLRRSGARIAIDDVGSGYASLRHVVDLQPDIIKIDRSLVSFIDKDPARHGLAIAFNQLAVSMGWTVVAEGIERPEELAVCSEIGISYGQGYLLARPAPLPSQLGPQHSWVAWSEEIGQAAEPLHVVEQPATPRTRREDGQRSPRGSRR
jgi:EAL domain-containing protein (putative c-di-GMP-specific phosphodiesterase class I)